MSKRYEIDGKRWMTIGDAARMLKITANGIRAMMGDDRLDWRQTRVNSRTFVVEEAAVLAMFKAKPRSVPPKSRIKQAQGTKLINADSPQRGELRTDHHLRLTVPHDGDAARTKKADPGSSPG